MQHELNLSDPEVKEHLVNYFLACEQFCWLFVLGERFKNTGNPPTPSSSTYLYSGLWRQEFTEVYKLLSPRWKSCGNVIWLNGWVAKVMNAPLDTAGGQPRESNNREITPPSYWSAGIQHNTAISPLPALIAVHYIRKDNKTCMKFMCFGFFSHTPSWIPPLSTHFVALGLNCSSLTQYWSIFKPEPPTCATAQVAKIMSTFVCWLQEVHRQQLHRSSRSIGL